MSDQDRFSPYNTNAKIKQASDKKKEKRKKKKEKRKKKKEKHQFGDY